MARVLRLIVVAFMLVAITSARKRPFRTSKKNDIPKRILAMKTESTINVQLTRARTVEIGFSFIQGAQGFVVSAKEWIDGKFEQSIETDRQMLDVQRRSAVLRNLIPGREYLIQVQALGKTRRPFGAVQERIIRTAQMCYVCNGVETNDECSAARDAIECPHDKDACINVVRYDNGQLSVTKRCAQYDPTLVERRHTSDACLGRENFNGRDSVCKCMCRSNLCNNLMLPCVDECLDELPVPLRSTLKCSHGRKVGSTCRWECPPGYMVKGLKDSKCRADRTWSVMSPPRCAPRPTPRGPRVTRRPSPRPRTSVVVKQKRPCKPLTRDVGVEITCTDEENHNSMCTVTCTEGFTMVEGTSTRVCRNTEWSGVDIICKEIHCPAVSSHPGFVNCSDSTKMGSVCTFANPLSMTCQGDGLWLTSGGCNEIPKDVYGPRSHTTVGCEVLQSPSYGDVKCTDGNNEESLCKYTCANGYVMIGETQMRRCTKGRWSGSPVSCEERKCGELISKSFVKEVINCSDDNRIGSVCDIITPSQVTCQADGSWSMPFKHAECKECKCP